MRRSPKSRTPPSDTLRRVAVSTLASFKPPPTLTVSEWADRNRVLSSEASAEPGRWATSRAEYLRGVMDAMSDPAIMRVVCVKAAQTGFTECLGNIVGYHIDQDPAPMLIVQPTLEMGEAWSKDRLAPMLRDTRCLAEKVSDPASRDSSATLRHRQFPGGRMTVVGANSAASLASRPIRIALCDEADRYPPSAGSEGDPLALVSKRQGTFWNKKILIGSTPTVRGMSVVQREFEASDMRRFFVPCLACNEMQFLKWANVRWDKDDDGKHKPETAHMICEACGSIWNDQDRWNAVRHGEWRATNPDGDPRVAGFHIVGLLSSWLTLADVVREFLTAKADPELLKVWTNTVIAEVWEEPSEKLEGSALIHPAEVYTPATIPDQVRLLVCGVDVQKDRLECTVLGFGPREETWAILHAILPGDPAQQLIWGELDRLLLDRYTTVTGRALRVQACCVDSGFLGDAVLAFCRARHGRRILAIKGSAEASMPIWPEQVTRAKRGKGKSWRVGVSVAKETIYSRLRITEPSPAYIHFPHGQGFGEEYFRQLTSEVVKTVYSMGRPSRKWDLPKGRRNETLDCFCYGLAARKSFRGLIEHMPAPVTPVPPPEPMISVGPPDPTAPNFPPPPPAWERPPRPGPARRVSRSRYFSA